VKQGVRVDDSGDPVLAAHGPVALLADLKT
jgi:hypothetical protein